MLLRHLIMINEWQPVRKQNTNSRHKSERSQPLKSRNAPRNLREQLFNKATSPVLPRTTKTVDFSAKHEHIFFRGSRVTRAIAIKIDEGIVMQ